MNCQECGGKTEIIDTEKFSMYVWRRRRCLKCGHRMPTHENFVDDPKTYRAKKQVEPKPRPEPKPKVVKAEVTPLPIRNTRKQIQDLREHLESKRENTGEE